VDRIGRYEILGTLGEGAYGVVYEAYLTAAGGFRKAVALKVLKQGGDLAREARLGGLLRHPNLVEVYALEQVDSTWVCAMELVRGGSLAGRVLPPRAVIEVGMQVCAGLEHAHAELDLIHLDIKPANLLLDGATVKVADLGIAGRHGERARGGTPRYMAPEQGRGEQVDVRADIYALGITLLELATGSREGSGHTWTGEVEPTVLPQSMPEWLEPVLERCLAPNPALRYPTMGALAEALANVEADGEGLAELLGAPTPTTVTLPGTRHASICHLPPEADAFVGRSADLDGLADALATPGVVALWGPAGAGKSRLAHHGVRQWSRRTGRPVWTCALSALSTEREVLHAVGAVLDVQPETERLAAALDARGRMVLVLDGVRTIAIAPMDTVNAVALLADRSGKPATGLSTAIAERLDCLPLAIELAAGRLRLMSEDKLLARLDRNLRMLGGPIRAALDASWDLLDDIQRSVLAQCSVFRGGFSLEAVDEVVEVPGERWSVDIVQELVDRSLLRVVGERLSLPSIVQAHAAEHLRDDGAAAGRHGAWCADLAATVSPQNPAQYLDDLANLAVASERAVARGDAATATATAIAASLLLQLRGPFERALALLSNALPGASRRGALDLRLTRGKILSNLGRSGEAEGDLRASLEEARALGQRNSEGRALAFLGGLLRQRAQYTEAEAHYREALVALEETGDDSLAASVVGNLGTAAMQQGRFEEALTRYGHALDTHRRLGERREVGTVLTVRGMTWVRMGRPDDAAADFEEAVPLLNEAGDRPFEAFVLEQSSAIHGMRGEFDRAAASAQAAVRVHQSMGNLKSAANALAILADVRRAQDRLDDAHALFLQSLDWLDQTGTATERGVLLALAGVEIDRARPEAAGELIERAAQIAIHTPSAAAKLQRRRAELLDATGHHAAAVEAYTEAIRLTDAGGDATDRVLARSRLGSLLLTMGEPAEARLVLLAAFDDLGSKTVDHDAWLHAALGEARITLGDAAGVEDLVLAEEAARRAGLRSVLCHVLCIRARVLHQPDALSEAQELASRLGVPPDSPLDRQLRRAADEVGVTGPSRVRSG
jgi:tetratricopeptide (TPR) repeat protein